MKLKTSNMKEKLKDWFYEFRHGHPFLLKEEADIICETRFDEQFMHFNDSEIQWLVRLRIENMYERRFPEAKPWTLPKTKK